MQYVEPVLFVFVTSSKKTIGLCLGTYWLTAVRGQVVPLMSS